MTLHIRLANDDDPAHHVIEITTAEQVFSPAQRYQSYIRVKGITFHARGQRISGSAARPGLHEPRPPFHL